MEKNQAHIYAKEIILEMIKAGGFPTRMDKATNAEEAKHYAEQITLLHANLYDYLVKQVK